MNNYPDGLSDHTPGTPWNDSPIPEKDFDVTCSQTLSKTVSVTTSNYIPGASGVDYEPDDEGGYYASSWHDPDDTSDTNWAEEYHENDYHTPIQLLALFKQFLEENMRSGVVFKSPKYTESLIKECEDWSEDETEFVEES